MRVIVFLMALIHGLIAEQLVYDNTPTYPECSVGVWDPHEKKCVKLSNRYDNKNGYYYLFYRNGNHADFITPITESGGFRCSVGSYRCSFSQEAFRSRESCQSHCKKLDEHGNIVLGSCTEVVPMRPTQTVRSTLHQCQSDCSSKKTPVRLAAVGIKLVFSNIANMSGYIEVKKTGPNHKEWTTQETVFYVQNGYALGSGNKLDLGALAKGEKIEIVFTPRNIGDNKKVIGMGYFNPEEYDGFSQYSDLTSPGPLGYKCFRLEDYEKKKANKFYLQIDTDLDGRPDLFRELSSSFVCIGSNNVSLAMHIEHRGNTLYILGATSDMKSVTKEIELSIYDKGSCSNGSGYLLDAHEYHATYANSNPAYEWEGFNIMANLIVSEDGKVYSLVPVSNLIGCKNSNTNLIHYVQGTTYEIVQPSRKCTTGALCAYKLKFSIPGKTPVSVTDVESITGLCADNNTYFSTTTHLMPYGGEGDLKTPYFADYLPAELVSDITKYGAMKNYADAKKNYASLAVASSPFDMFAGHKRIEVSALTDMKNRAPVDMIRDIQEKKVVPMPLWKGIYQTDRLDVLISNSNLPNAESNLLEMWAGYGFSPWSDCKEATGTRVVYSHQYVNATLCDRYGSAWHYDGTRCVTDAKDEVRKVDGTLTLGTTSFKNVPTCTFYHYSYPFTIKNVDDVKKFQIFQEGYDDHMVLVINGHAVFSKPESGMNKLPDSRASNHCEHSTYYRSSTKIDLKPYLKNGVNVLDLYWGGYHGIIGWIKVAVEVDGPMNFECNGYPCQKNLSIQKGKQCSQGVLSADKKQCYAEPDCPADFTKDYDNHAKCVKTIPSTEEYTVQICRPWWRLRRMYQCTSETNYDDIANMMSYGYPRWITIEKNPVEYYKSLSIGPDGTIEENTNR